MAPSSKDDIEYSSSKIHQNCHHIFILSILTSLALIETPAPVLAQNELYQACGEPFRCANHQNLSYPFWGSGRPVNCGHPAFQLDCRGADPTITIDSRTYVLLSIDDSTRTLNVAREDLREDLCLTSLHNTTLDYNVFDFVTSDDNVTLYYDCSSLIPQLPAFPNQFACGNSSGRFNLFVARELANTQANFTVISCRDSIFVPVNGTAYQVLSSSASVAELRGALASGFSLEWDANNAYCERCSGSGGRCGHNPDTASFACYCSDRPHDVTCDDSSNGGNSNRSQVSLGVGLGVGGAVFAGIGIGWLIFFYKQKRKKRHAALAGQTQNSELPTPSSQSFAPSPSPTFTKSIPSYPSTTEFGKGSSYFGVHVYSYSELEEATDNFDPSRELGDGGFGTVYYGKLNDGRIVAVKRLYENNFKRVEQFMNEVEILTRLRHKNLVALYGCTSKRSRELLLVYEYIPNGTVADHLHGKKAKPGLLSWPVRLNIAIETADALAYLHSSDVIHRDVKTNNVLLDNDFHVKVADFGLSRLFPNDATHVSTAPQGTPGYVDPEYYSCYQLTEKSDVYSFGVVLIELVSSLPAVDTNRLRLDINLASMAVNKIQNQAIHELFDPSLGFETNSSMRRMATLVAELAFRCLQQDRDLRPTMKEVLDVLKGIQTGANVEKAEVLEVLVDDSFPLKGDTDFLSPSPNLFDTDSKRTSSSTTNSSG